MAVTATPVFTQAPLCLPAVVSAANTNRDGTGTIVDVVPTTTNGARIDRVTVTFTVTSTAGMIRLYVHDGSNYRLIKEIAVTAVTGSASVPEFTAEWSRSDGLPVVDLPAGSKLGASTHNAEASVVVATGGYY
jgi:hypothetical protein